MAWVVGVLVGVGVLAKMIHDDEEPVGSLACALICAVFAGFLAVGVGLVL